MVKRLASGLTLWVAAGLAHAACSGSGLTWTCTAGSTAAQINGAISSASDGATITLEAGTYSAQGIDLTPRDGVTVICASSRACSMTAAGYVFSLNPSTTYSNLMRISGFKFTGAGDYHIWVYGSGNIDKLRIDDNWFDDIGGSSTTILLGEVSATGRIHGVVDGNLFSGANNYVAMHSMHGGFTWQTGLQGTGNNLFFENNTIDFTNNSDLTKGGIDAWRSGGIVVRYNTFTNSRIVNHSLCHGGPANAEIYGNTVSSPTGSPANYRNVHLQGSGEIIAFDNVLSAHSGGSTLVLQHYRADASQLTQGDCDAVEICDGDFTSASGVPQTDGNRSGKVGYPCWHQPGRNGSAQMKPVYQWLNRTPSNALVSFSVESGSWTGLNADCANNDNDRINCHIQTDRDLFQAVSASAQSSATSPFNGTTGVGFGTLANRPTTCSAGTNVDTEDAGMSGVAYWATDVKTLYRCATTNSWAVHYRPYVYPHPLVSGNPAPPLNPRAK